MITNHINWHCRGKRIGPRRLLNITRKRACFWAADANCLLLIWIRVSSSSQFFLDFRPRPGMCAAVGAQVFLEVLARKSFVSIKSMERVWHVEKCKLVRDPN